MADNVEVPWVILLVEQTGTTT